MLSIGEQGKINFYLCLTATITCNLIQSSTNCKTFCLVCNKGWDT